MQRYFITSEEKDSLCLKGEKHHHIKNVMRNKTGDKIEIVCQGKVSLCQITSIKDETCFEILEDLFFNPEFPFEVTIVQGYPKQDKLEDIIKHGTELGLNRLFPCLMDRSIVKIDKAKRNDKKERLSKIALEAAMQSKRNVVPVIEDIKTLKEIDFSAYDFKLVAYEEEATKENHNLKEVLNSLKEKQKLIIVVGPEGGLSSDEIAYLKQQNFLLCSLGKRILRTETASLFILSCLGYLEI